jgi:CheY-like chemotaxis protein
LFETALLAEGGQPHPRKIVTFERRNWASRCRTIVRVLVPPEDEPRTVRASQTRGPTPKTTLPHPRRILLIEDDAWIRTFLRDVLSDEGYAVIEAADGRTGLRLAFEESPDVVLLDLAMPEFTGMDVLHGLKRIPRTRAIPVLIHSAYAAVLSAADVASVAGVLSKPTDVATLLTAIQNAVGAGKPRTRGSAVSS